MEQILERVKAILADKDIAVSADLTPETAFEALGIDSLDLAELMFAVEEEFNIDLSEEESPATVGDFLAMVASKIA